jgi:hypothetical protein
MNNFVPLNYFEVLLQEANSGRVPIQELLGVLVETSLALASASEILDDGSGFRPLLFPKDRVQMLACFSDKARIGTFVSLAPYCLMMNGRDILSRVPPGFGLVLNPGESVGLEISYDGIRNIISDFVGR